MGTVASIFLGSQFTEILKYRQAFKLTFITLVILTVTESMDKSKKMLLSEDMDVQKMCKSCKYSLFQFWETMFVQQ